MKVRELNLHCEPTCYNLNELDYHAYFIPFESLEKSTLERENSAFFYSLNGEWSFHYEKSGYDFGEFPDCYYSNWEKINLPENWQMHGKDYIQYQTSPYTFIYNPPYPPKTNPCAGYVKEFDFKKEENKRYELHFEGKDSCVYVWLNSAFIGYGEVPHNDSSFDITDKLKDGKNRLSVLVFKWCSGSYLDDQDKIRLSGIFRDVYILERAKNGIKDFLITADDNGNLNIKVDAKSKVTATLLYKNKQILNAQIDQEFNAKIESVLTWSAETPNLYDLILYCDGEYIRKKVGFRSVQTKNGLFLVNGKPIKIYGVNRHDFSPDTGYCLTPEFIRSELCLMKKNNINAVRTAHYPNDPRFYEICDELGIYVMCEGDVECHGVSYVNGWDEIVEHEQFEGAFVDRIARMYQSLKNFPSIVIWSLGNESGWGKNLEKCTEYLRANEKTRPLHYEAFTMRNGFNLGEENNTTPIFNSELDKYVTQNFGMVALGYPRIETLNKAITNKAINLPIVFHEYSHAMGNSCGDLKIYDEIVQKHDRCMGGFIWEWCDQAVRLKDENGVTYLGYGGDFGEQHHLYNVCMDGLVSADRMPHSALFEASACFSPIKITKAKDGFEIFNRNYFTNASIYNFNYQVVVDNKTIDGGVLSVDILPREKTIIQIPLKEKYDGEYAIISFSVSLKEKTCWCNSNHVVYATSFELNCEKKTESKRLLKPTLIEKDSEYIISANEIEYVIRKDSGVISQIKVKGKSLLKSPLEFTAWRMPTDNDNVLVSGEGGTIYSSGGVAKLWRKTPRFGEIYYAWLDVGELVVNSSDKGISLFSQYVFAVPGRLNLTKGEIEYFIDGKGALTISQKGEFNNELYFYLPRYGYRLFLDGEVKNVNYFGFGPNECYEDKCEYASLGFYDYVVDDENNSYEKPQECNSRCYTKDINFNIAGVPFNVKAKDCSFNITKVDITKGWQYNHKKDLPKEKGTYLHLDYRMSGVGSRSCGGNDPDEKYRINAGEKFDFSITITPKN